MKIGIIIHSQSGNTRLVALKLQEKLSTLGHNVTIEPIEPIGDAHPGVKNLQLKTYPEIAKYEGLIFAAPVWAFNISPVLTAYLSQLSTLKDKKITAFVTMGFPFPWMGGNRAIAMLKKICRTKGATIAATAIICRSGNYQKAITNMKEIFSEVY
ncbi:MAG: flavodoxin [Firmicutes bacterium]|nr:flavodoxin [Bacillota bacterium]